ncbi:alkene reductase [Bacillus sp. REN3]|uniref:oxidoreductase n=1 Tax=Bacillus sp. REN3 TaxID=2802440 RepID=UPI001AED53E8
MDYPKLLESVKVEKWKLRNRIVMAPMTRGFADDRTGTVGKNVVEYYRRRAEKGAGLIITEGIAISRRAKGTFGVPGLYTEEQVRSWVPVTEAVHKEGGTIVAQLWHVGRLTHSELTGGLPPQAPSTLRAEGLVHRLRKPYEMPCEMSVDEIKDTIKQFAKAAKNAMAAGFDGVEIHGAHGYLIDQFNSDISNLRTDQYGGGLATRLTFMKEVIHAVMAEAGEERTVIRFSALKDDHPEYMWDHPDEAIQTFTKTFKETGIKILHPSTNHFEDVISGGLTLHQMVREYWKGTIIGVGGLTPASAEEAIKRHIIDLAAFGRPLLSNPDFSERIKQGNELIPYNPEKHLAILK